jgi:hypothetical protein
MRLFLMSLTAVTMFFVASTASAVEFTLLSAGTVSVTPGESFTVSIALDNINTESNQGVVGTITGMAGVVNVVSGVSATGLDALGEAGTHFVNQCFSSMCFGGITNNSNTFFNADDLAGEGYGGAGSDLVTIVSALSSSAGAATGANDPGLGNTLGAPQGAHNAEDVSIVLVAVGSGELTIGGTFASGGNQPITSTATLTVNVIPEPGTALLMGLGLAGLASAGRRRD